MLSSQDLQSLTESDLFDAMLDNRDALRLIVLGIKENGKDAACCPLSKDAPSDGDCENVDGYILKVMLFYKACE